MTAVPLDADVDGIAIIDGLERSERHKYQDTAKLIEVIRGVSGKYLGPVKMCDSKYAYLDALDHLISEAQHGHKYVLHLECHGSPDGLQMGTDEVTWDEQLPRLTKLNQTMNGELVIDLSACNGIYASRMAGLQHAPPPFYAVIGPAKEICMKCAAVISKAFYSEYLGAAFGSLDKAMALANAKLRYPVLKGIRSEIFLQEQMKGYPFRPMAKDDERIDCLSDGSLRVVEKCSPAI